MYSVKVITYKVEQDGFSDIISLSIYYTEDLSCIEPCISVLFSDGSTKIIPPSFIRIFLERNQANIGISLAKEIQKKYLALKKEIAANDVSRMSIKDVVCELIESSQINTDDNNAISQDFTLSIPSEKFLFNRALQEDHAYLAMNIDYEKLSDNVFQNQSTHQMKQIHLKMINAIANTCQHRTK